MDEFERWWEAYDDPHGHGRPHKEAARIGYEAGLRRAAKECAAYINAADSGVRPLVALGCPELIRSLAEEVGK